MGSHKQQLARYKLHLAYILWA